EIPSIDVYLPVYHGTKEETLLIGVGHLENTSLPAGGESTHAVLSAHCGLPSARLFTDLHLLKEGSLFRIHVLDETLTYQVYDIETVDPDDSSSLLIKEGEDLVTLITCTPYGKNTHRLLVHGKRIEEEQAKNIEEPEIEKNLTWEDYTSIAAIAITAVFVILLCGGAVRGIIRRKKKHEKAD
ncbi:MAG: class C sortase, partial [Acutalibacteraceae bacterium]